MDRRLTGILGEETAAKYYRAKGYTLLAANFRTRQGELDLVVQKGSLLVFAEVKTRQSDTALRPAEAVTPAKQRRLLAAARAYLAQLGQEPDAIRFDVVEVFCQNGKAIRVNCMENAFWEP